jgi:hypothetical protein
LKWQNDLAVTGARPVKCMIASIEIVAFVVASSSSVTVIHPLWTLETLLLVGLGKANHGLLPGRRRRSLIAVDHAVPRIAGYGRSTQAAQTGSCAYAMRLLGPLHLQQHARQRHGGGHRYSFNQRHIADGHRSRGFSRAITYIDQGVPARRPCLDGEAQWDGGDPTWTSVLG